MDGPLLLFPLGMSIVHRFCISLAEKQIGFLRDLSDLTGLPLSEVLRRAVDHCSREPIANEVFPNVSGQIFPQVVTRKQ